MQIACCHQSAWHLFAFIVITIAILGPSVRQLPQAPQLLLPVLLWQLLHRAPLQLLPLKVHLVPLPPLAPLLQPQAPLLQP